MSDYSFGLKADEGTRYVFWWGARAIFHPAKLLPTTKIVRRNGKRRRIDDYRTVPASLDFLPDRQSWDIKSTDDARKEQFRAWVRKVALPACTKWAQCIESSSSERFELKQDAYVFTATPNSSYGYMYIGAWEIENHETPQNSTK